MGLALAVYVLTHCQTVIKKEPAPPHHTHTRNHIHVHTDQEVRQYISEGDIRVQFPMSVLRWFIWETKKINHHFSFSVHLRWLHSSFGDKRSATSLGTWRMSLPFMRGTSLPSARLTRACLHCWTWFYSGLSLMILLNVLSTFVRFYIMHSVIGRPWVTGWKIKSRHSLNYFSTVLLQNESKCDPFKFFL